MQYRNFCSPIPRYLHRGTNLHASPWSIVTRALDACAAHIIVINKQKAIGLRQHGEAAGQSSFSGCHRATGAEIHANALHRNVVSQASVELFRRHLQNVAFSATLLSLASSLTAEN